MRYRDDAAARRDGASFGLRRAAEETRERFLRAILARVSLDRIAAVHLFAPIRQGAVESGVAVVAARLPEGGEDAEDGTRGPPPETNIAHPPPDDLPIPSHGGSFERRPSSPDSPGAGPRPLRHTVLTARYRLTIKGPDRGRWDADVVEEADAPLVAVEAVVRGVQRRAGDDAVPERLDLAALARLVGGPTPDAPGRGGGRDA